MPSAWFQVNHDCASLLQGQQVLGNAGFTRADSRHNVAARCRAVR